MSDQTGLEGKRVLVTGGTTGIGRATVALLAQQGAHVLTFGRHQPELDEALANAGGSSARGSVDGLIADVAKREDIERVFAAVDDKLGGIDVLISNAGLSAGPVHETAEDEWRYVVETNLVGSLSTARQAIQRMEKQGGGHLVFVGSISARNKSAGESVYAATKAGLQVFAETLRTEVGDKNIRVSMIEPGSVATPMQPSSSEEQQQAIASHEMLYAEEIAEAIHFMLTRSERNDIVTLRIEPRIQKTS